MPIWWRIAYGFSIAYALLMLYAGAVLLFAGCCGQTGDTFINVIQILTLPALLVSIRKPVAMSVLFFVFGGIYVVLASLPRVSDPFGPAVPDHAAFLRDIVLFLGLPTIAIGLLIRWRSELPSRRNLVNTA